MDGCVTNARRFPCRSIANLAVLVTVALGFFGHAEGGASPRKMEATAYDDGRSCPGNCDAHVVFHPSHNGTLNAYDADSGRQDPQPCQAGQPCHICFGAQSESCMTAIYRGAGPSAGRFDFPPAFYAENCDRDDLPATFARICRGVNSRVIVLSSNINCFEQPEHPKCRTLMERVSARKAADDRYYLECKAVGEATYNQKYFRQRNLQRSNSCTYEKYGTGRNSRGQTWKKLLDGACLPNTYVGADGLDCCSASLYSAALFGRECTGFFPAP